MNLLFSFLEPNRPHSALLAGYFSKVWLVGFMYLVIQCFMSKWFFSFMPVSLSYIYVIIGCCMPYATEDCSAYELCSSKCSSLPNSTLFIYFLSFYFI